jgi:flagellar hook-length control protein FliK
LKGAPAPKPGSTVAVVGPTRGDASDLAPTPVELAGNAQTEPASVDTVSALPAELALAIPLGNAAGKTTAASSRAAPSGKISDSSSGIHTRATRQSDQNPAVVAQVQIGQSAPAIPVTALGLPPQPPVGMVSVPTRAPPVPGPAIAAAPPTMEGDKVTDPDRSVPSDPHDEPPAGPDHPAAGASSVSDADAGKFAVSPGAMPETAALTMGGDVSQATPSGPVLSPLLPTDQTQPATPADRAAPADQIAPAVVGILQTTDGPSSVTVRLQPAELGQVQIRVDQTVAGAAHIAITAERPETLQLLQRDEPRLQQALDQAGILSTGRTFSFQVAAPEQVGAAASRPDSMAAGSGGSGQGQSGGAWRQNGDSQRDFGNGSGPDQGQARTRWFRAGLDITA